MDLILTLTGGLTAAVALGMLAQRLRLSPIVGYLCAGVVVGPFTPGFVAHAELANEMAEIGIILLMFGVGLHFHLKELLAVRRVAIPGAIVGIGAATALGVVLAKAIGWSVGAGVVFGMAIGVASTVVLLRVLADHDALHTRPGHVAVGWLVVEDLLTVLAIVLIPAFAGPRENASAAATATAIALAVAKIAALVAFTLLVGRRVVPLIFGFVAKTRSRELFTLTVLVVALGIAVGSAKLFGASMALGAFLAGMVVGQSEFSARAASDALPMRDAFAVLFFVSVGMLLDPRQILPNAALSAAALAIVMIGKPIAVFAAVRALGQPSAVALAVAASLAQIGEFSFVLAALGRKLDLVSEHATQAIVAASMISITLNPIVFRAARSLARRLDAVAPAGGANTAVPSADAAHRVVVVGYGPVGRTLTRLLRENGLEPTVVELNHETVAELNRAGVHAIYGDATQAEILRRAGVEDARGLVFAASGSSPEAVIVAARQVNPDIPVLARSTYVREVPAARAAGAEVVVAAEAEVALAMTEHLLAGLGASGEQLDRERERVRAELADVA